MVVGGGGVSSESLSFCMLAFPNSDPSTAARCLPVQAVNWLTNLLSDLCIFNLFVD